MSASDGNFTINCSDKRNLEQYAALALAVLTAFLQIIGGLIPNIRALLDLFLPKEAQKRDAAKIRRKLTEVHEVLASISPNASQKAKDSPRNSSPV